MSAEVLSGIGQAIGSAIAATESISSVGSAMPSLGESIGSLGSFAPESIPTDFSAFERAFEPTDISVFEKAFTEPIANSPLEITDEAFRHAIKGFENFDNIQDSPTEDVVPQSFEKAFEPTDISVFEKDFTTQESEISIPNVEEDLSKTKVSSMVSDFNEIDLAKVKGIENDSQVTKLDLPTYQNEFVSSMIDKAELDVQQDIIQDAKLAGKVETLLEEVGFSQNDATIIATRSFEEAAVKKGIELKPKESLAEINPETETQTQPLAQEIANAKEETKTSLAKDEENKTKSENQKSKAQETVLFVRDENTNSERKKDAQQAISKTFSKNTEEKDGIEIVSNMHTPPNANETSEIIRKKSGNTDGSYEEVLKDIQIKRFSSKKEAEEATNTIIDQKPAVKLATSGKAVGEKDVRRVLRTKYPFSSL